LSLVALTGASGYTGGHLAAALKGAGFSVRALVRSRTQAAPLEALGAEVVVGALEEPSCLPSLVAGASAVVHTAAVYRTAGHAPRYYHDVNVGGTLALLEAAEKAGVGRFVHTSTVGVHGNVKAPPADEASPIAPGDVYQESKAEAEAAALRFGRERGLPVVVVRPGAIYGPREGRFLKLFRAIARGRYAVVGSGRPYYHPVYIDDLVSGFLLALASPRAPGEAFILAGPRYVSQEELARLVARATGGRVLPFRIPALPLQLAGSLVEAALTPFGVEPPLHRRRVDFWTKSRAFSIEKARRVLGYAPKVDLEEGFARTAASYREAGWL
jgi:nucleoside-diphosphate-sugar epimerase